MQKSISCVDERAFQVGGEMLQARVPAGVMQLGNRPRGRGRRANRKSASKVKCTALTTVHINSGQTMAGDCAMRPAVVCHGHGQIAPHGPLRVPLVGAGWRSAHGLASATRVPHATALEILQRMPVTRTSRPRPWLAQTACVEMIVRLGDERVAKRRDAGFVSSTFLRGIDFEDPSSFL